MYNAIKTKGIGEENEESINKHLIMALYTITTLEISNCKTDMKFNNYKHLFFLKMGI